MNKIIKKISQAVQVLLLAPIKLPAKALNIIKYVAVGLGILEAMTSEKEEEEPVPNSLGEEGVK
ncbi:hypothetical protein [Sphingobacterium yanglingense]|uniref:Uncharacterized protein n=1 Tax=Sphingobacterium yanglingense TaxID=1437280 RepID=A0A4R6WGM1_9SPHI|nr:hypothetical protein [Sphingobacterium yanglingense]TDQ79310.1 hypothetical protein CLV99_0746 [Sphingobacterium yanglingense]